MFKSKFSLIYTFVLFILETAYSKIAYLIFLSKPLAYGDNI
jgi:hypothetical protein